VAVESAGRPWLAPLAAAAVTGALGTAGTLLRRPWHDELYTLELARRPASAILQALHLDSGPPGYYLLCHLLYLGGADSVRAFRVLSVAAIAAAAALVVLALPVGRARWAAAALFSLHPLVLAAAADARPYAVVVALTAAVLLVLASEPSRATTAALGLLLAAACWIHSLGLILTGAVLVVGLVLPTAQRRRALLAVLAALALHLPWLGVMLQQPPASLAWMTAGWQQLPAWWRPLLPLTQPGPAAFRTPFLHTATPPLMVALAGTVFWVVLAGVGAASHRIARLALYLWLTMGASLVVGTALLRPIYAPDRADKILVPLAIVAVSAAALRSRTLLACILALSLAGGWAAASTLAHWKTLPPRPEELAGRALSELVRPGDLVIVTSWWLLGVRHGVGPRGQGVHWVTFPLETARHPGWYDDSEARDAAPQIPVLQEMAGEAVRRGHRVFLLRSPSLPSNRLLDRLVAAAGFVPVTQNPPYWQLWVAAPPAELLVPAHRTMPPSLSSPRDITTAAQGRTPGPPLSWLSAARPGIRRSGSRPSSHHRPTARREARNPGAPPPASAARV